MMVKILLYTLHTHITVYKTQHNPQDYFPNCKCVKYVSFRAFALMRSFPFRWMRAPSVVEATTGRKSGANRGAGTARLPATPTARSRGEVCPGTAEISEE